MPPKKQPESVRPALIVFWRHARRYKLALFLTVFFGAAVQVVSVIVPLFYKQLFDVLSSASGVPGASVIRELFIIIFIIAAFQGADWLFRRVAQFASTHLQPRVMADLVQTSFDCLLGHSYSFFANSFTGSLVRKVNRIARSFEQVVDQIEWSFIPIIVSVAGIITVLFLRHPLLGGIFAAWVAILLVVQYGITRWKQKYNLALSAKDSEATGVLSDAITNAVTIKLFSGKEYEQSLYNKVTEELRALRFRTWSIDEWINAAQGALAIAIEFGLLYAAIVLWQRGVVTVGDFALIQAYIVNAVMRLWHFGSSMRKTYEALAEAQEMVDILNLPYDIRDRRGAKKLSVTKGEIEFKNVVFSFRKTRRVLDGFTLTIAGKEKVALVGSSGAGKSTITQLLFRFHNLEDGEILIDGRNIASVAQDSVRSSIAFVPQEPILFHRTLKENIRYGRRNASDEEIIKAARKAHAHEFISAFPDGYDTYVGERGVKLSGGERQRIAIARAILKDAPILALDEATSSLDSESEALIQDALALLMKEKTVIVIAHRLSTIRRMDRIIVIEEGKVAASGTHEELLEHEGAYKTLWETQVGGFIK